MKTKELDFGDAIHEIWITANLRSRERKPRETLEALFDRFHVYIKSMPRITFRRKLQQVEIHFLSGHFTDEDDRAATTEVDADAINLAACEVAEALTMLKKRIKPADNLDCDAFFTHTTNVLTTGLPTTESWNEVHQQAISIRMAILERKDPWELLDLDGDKFHPDARTLLDDLFFWKATDDFAPHGNDTGADLLEDFRTWNKRNSDKSPLKFLDRLLKSWQIAPVDWLETDPARARQMYERDAIAFNVCNQAAIALAFATIKHRGHSPPDVVEYGLAALKRTDVLFSDDSIDAALQPSWNRRSQQMQNKLQTFAGS